jgi:P pilus assembly chaperone PapD
MRFILKAPEAQIGAIPLAQPYLRPQLREQPPQSHSPFTDACQPARRLQPVITQTRYRLRFSIDCLRRALRWNWRWLSLFIALPGSLASAQGSAIAVAPVTVKMEVGLQFAAVEVSNRGDRPTGIETEVVRVRWVDGREEYESTEDFIVSPPAFRLASQKSRLVRFRFGGMREETEGFYRLFVRQLAEQEGTGNQVNMVFKLGVPIFVAPSVSRPSLTLVKSGVNAGRISNSGNVTLTLSQVEGERCHGETHKLAVRLAPQQSVAISPKIHACATLVQTDRGPVPLSSP